ncbi:hypothetical protein ACHAWT_002299 [Skeletonema menzelii]
MTLAAFLLPPNSNSILLHQRCCGDLVATLPVCNNLSPSFSQLINPLSSSPDITPTSLALASEPTLLDVPISTPLVLLAAVALAVLAQSWINSLLGGDQGLGAFLSDGTGYNKSGFKPRKKSPNSGDPSKPLGGADPLPWLKLPEFDYVDVAGQPKKPKQPGIIPNSSANSSSKNEAEVVSRLEFLFARMKEEVENDNLIEAKRFELELEKIMEEEGFRFSSKQ